MREQSIGVVTHGCDMRRKEAVSLFGKYLFETRIKKALPHCDKAFLNGVPKGIRTPVTAVKGRCPRPLDDGDVYDLRTSKSIPSLSPVINSGCSFWWS